MDSFGDTVVGQDQVADHGRIVSKAARRRVRCERSKLVDKG